jgi:hypothetical protein
VKRTGLSMKRNGHKQINSIADLSPDSRNANKGTPRGQQMVEDSLRKYGAGRSILADKKGRIIAGNKTLQSASDIDLPVRVVESDGKELIVVQRTDLDLNDPRARELAIADNRTAQTGLEWDADVLAQLKDEGVDLSGMFTEKELAAILPQGESKDAEPQIDKAAELQQKWGTETGQLWEIGKHRLLVGDSTNKADVGRLCGENRPLLMVTDPPYGVEYDANWRQEAAKSGHLAYAPTRIGAVQNDARMDWRETYEIAPSDVAYLWHDALSGGAVQGQIEAAGFQLRNQIIWAKSNFPISRGNYHWRHEACWYAVRKGRKSGWIGDHAQTTLWEINLDKNTDGGHSTQKPLECMARPIRNHEGDVYDPFVGSGTTLVAAENLNRTCYAIEISPAYVAVCLERMSTAFPHLEIKRQEVAVAA